MQRWILATVLTGVAGVVSAGEHPVRKLTAEYQHGQTFLTWEEVGLPAVATLNVYLSKKPIRGVEDLEQARKVCAWIEPHSATDWTRDKGNYGKGRVKDKKTGLVPEALPPVGYILREGGERLAPEGGLHVHTVAPDEEMAAHYAVTVTTDGKEDRTIVLGSNSLQHPVVQNCAPIQPIWQGPGNPPIPTSGRGKPLLVFLHGKGNRGACKYIVFGDKTHCWREGVPFMFDVSVGGKVVTLLPSNTLYTGTSYKEGVAKNRDICAIWSFWYGCSDQFPQTKRISKGTPTNYSERRLLFEIEWVKRRFGTDPMRSYCQGSSMGGCGTMSFGYRHPEIFAAVRADVPIIAYNTGDREKGRALGWHDNTFRMVPFCGPFSLTTSDGLPLWKRMDAREFVLSHPRDLPYLVIHNGRKDTSIPWHNNPGLYRALQSMRQGCAVAWNEGIHPTARTLLPDDFTKRMSLGNLLRFSLDKSFLAFSNCSRDEDPGNGDSTDGDGVGFMNRGLDWGEPGESAARYEVLVTYGLDAAHLPLTVDVTPRRRQAFKMVPGAVCTAVNLDGTGREIQRVRLTADPHGL
ncbi:MAG: hypothetical protein KAI66_20030, partial [Lentisphaeria bacterium]|nr:hypothetical protein [Lentisphaeria bacterium]